MAAATTPPVKEGGRFRAGGQCQSHYNAVHTLSSLFQNRLDFQAGPERWVQFTRAGSLEYLD
jgi:hypothetical protein